MTDHNEPLVEDDVMIEQTMDLPVSLHPISADKICKRSFEVVQRLQQAGHQAYLVGGCVRDLLLGQTPKDFDIATSAHPEQVRRLFSSCRLIGRRFRLAHIYFGRDYIEVATFRAPHDSGAQGQGQVNDDGRITHDNVYGTLEEDVWRRDFTINALFYDPIQNEILDYVGGLRDLEERCIRLIGDPENRFREDPVRMLRAIRFAAKLDFEISPETRDLIKPMAPLLDGVAAARLFDEILKMLHSGSGKRTFELLCEYDILPFLLPVTDDSLHEDKSGVFARLLDISLSNTDRRVRSGLSVMPPFLYAVLLWHKVNTLALQIQDEGYPEMQAMQIAASEVLNEQVDFTSIPRRFSNITREIWGLQLRFRVRDLRRASALLHNNRFRAAYDFLCLRAQAGEPVAEDCAWWTAFQEAEGEARVALCDKIDRSRARNNRRRRRH